jgi:hydroxypyruvate isomerase
MLRFSLAINVALLEYDIYDRIRIAADIGYDGVDIYGDHTGMDGERLRKTAEDAGVSIVSPGLRDAFRMTLNLDHGTILPVWEEAFRFARACGSTGIVALGGTVSRIQAEPKKIIIENLRRLAPLAEEAGIFILLEPQNNVIEHRDVYLHSSALGFEILERVESPYVKLLFDFIHLQLSEGNVLQNSGNNLPMLGHFHCGGIPGHDEPFHSELDYPYILHKLDEAGFSGFLGAEYAPTYESIRSASDTLRYLKSYQKSETGGIMAWKA